MAKVAKDAGEFQGRAANLAVPGSMLESAGTSPVREFSSSSSFTPPRRPGKASDSGAPRHDGVPANQVEPVAMPISTSTLVYTVMHN